MNCKHIIALLHESDTDVLITVDELNEHIRNEQEFFKWLHSEGRHLRTIRDSAYTIDDYRDIRKSTDITRFKFCPMCGKKIEWKNINKKKELADKAFTELGYFRVEDEIPHYMNMKTGYEIIIDMKTGFAAKTRIDDSKGEVLSEDEEIACVRKMQEINNENTCD